MTVFEDSSLDEAVVFGILTLEGDNNAVVGCVREGDSAVVCDLD